MPSPRSTRNSVHSAIVAAGNSTAPTSAVTTLSTPPPVSVNPSVITTSSLSSTRSIRTVDDLIAERLAESLPKFSATNATEFMNWAYLVINHFHIIPGFEKSILDLPRDEISFSHVTDEQVTFIYTYLWQRLFPIVSQLPGIHTKLQRVPIYEVHSLWKVLKEAFCPQTNIELVQKGRLFLEMCQGRQTIREFTTSVLAERDLLLFMGIAKSDDEVRNTIICGLTLADAQTYAFRFVTLPIDRFVEEVNQYDTLVVIQSQRRNASPGTVESSSELANSSTSTLNTALLTEVRPSSYRHIQCWHCDMWGHHQRDCPDILIPKEELPKRKEARSDNSLSRTTTLRGGGLDHPDSRGSNRWHRGGRYRGRRRDNGSHYRASPSGAASHQDKESEGYVAVAIVDSGANEDQSMSMFDWSSAGPFIPMDNTFELSPLIKEEQVSVASLDNRLAEKHID